MSRSPRAPDPDFLAQVDRHPAPVSCRATDYPAGHMIAPHAHAKSQLIYAVHGVMMVSAGEGRWIVPPTRGIWMPAGLPHAIRCIGEVHMRSIYVRPDAAPHLPTHSQAVGISPLLRELIQAATEVDPGYAANSRDGRVMRLLLDELHALPVLPLHLPQPADPRLHRICSRLLAAATRRHHARRLGPAPVRRCQDPAAPVRARDWHDLQQVAPAGAPAARPRAARHRRPRWSMSRWRSATTARAPSRPCSSASSDCRRANSFGEVGGRTHQG